MTEHPAPGDNIDGIGNFPLEKRRQNYYLTNYPNEAGGGGRRGRRTKPEAQISVCSFLSLVTNDLCLKP